MNAIDNPDEKVSADDRELIRGVLLFAGKIHCNAGRQLIDTGQQARCFYYVEKGTFEVSYSSENTNIVVALIGQGSIFGEIGYFDRMARTRNIRAVEDARVRVFDEAAMDAIRSHDADIYARFMEFLMRLVCVRFRRILSDQGPLTAYAASLSTGREKFEGLQPLPADLLGSSGWQNVRSKIEAFKAVLFDISYQLQKHSGEDIPADLQAKGEAILDEFKVQIREYENGVTPEYATLMWGYVFKEVFPYFMRSRFAERAYYKPKGYAGDFKMMELIYAQKPDGDGKLGRLIDGWLLNQVPSRAVRNRRRLLCRLLDRLCRQRLGKGGPVRIMNLACGPSRELFDLLNQCDYSDRIEALCIDIDSEALRFADQHVDTRDHQATIRYMNENIIKWSLGRTRHDLGAYDIIYSSGLCDYLDRRLMKGLLSRCHAHLAPGGVLIIGNFSPANPDRNFMDNLLYWRLIHRDEQEMRSLFADSPFGDRVELTTEEQGVNLFAIAGKA